MKINYYVEGKILIWSGYPLVAAINQAIQGAVFSRFPVWQARAAGHCFCVLAIAGCGFWGGLSELHCERSWGHEQSM